MKIGVMIDRLNVGGVEKIALEQVAALRKAGEDAYLVVLRQKAVVPNAFPDLKKKVPIVYLDQRLPRILRFSFSFPVFSFFSLFHLTYPLYFPFVVKKNEFDYFIVHGTYTCLTASTLQKFRKIRYSAFIWDPVSYILERVYSTNFLTPIMWLLKKVAYHLDVFLINNMDNVLVGGVAHNRFIKRVNPKKKIVVLYPSVHPAKKLVKKKDYVLMVTAWKKGKNPEYILEITKQIPNVTFKMAGKWIDPDYKKEFTTLIKNSGSSKQIDVVGSVSEEQLTKLYGQAQVLLQTNDDRGFGMPAMEAAGNGTTFIIPHGQGVCSLFTDGEDGFYTKERDTAKIVSLLKKLTSNSKLSTAMGHKAWEKVTANYSWDQHAYEIKSLVAKSLKS